MTINFSQLVVTMHVKHSNHRDFRQVKFDACPGFHDSCFLLVSAQTFRAQDQALSPINGMSLRASKMTFYFIRE